MESANQLSLVTTYGIAPVSAALLFSFLAALSRTLASHVSFFRSTFFERRMLFARTPAVVAAPLRTAA